jgi:hypothetical protein
MVDWLLSDNEESLRAIEVIALWMDDYRGGSLACVMDRDCDYIVT